MPVLRLASAGLTIEHRVTHLWPMYNIANKIKLMYAAKKSEVLQGTNAWKPCVMIMRTLKPMPYQVK